ncbi:shikimate kinase [Luxibacter massiliensis]|uniref:shikimate kinase n=1 Tax=Luxibacter massiliensis TaxID=2219695 RepID=UPI000F0609B8|nr:shikimate kinase [Luxibacter massiliensis]
MNDLEMYREQLALCDDKIIDALVERYAVIEKIMAYKEEYGMPILQPMQEEKQERRLGGRLHGNKYQEEIYDVFKRIVRNSKRIQARKLFSGNIVLIGFMGAGKSSVSEYMSTMLAMKMIDMDQEIAEREGMSIPDIFATYGEEYFRGQETRLLEELEMHKNVIISCGGGAALREENIVHMKKNGCVVLLTASPQTVYERVKGSDDRPLLKDNNSLESIACMMEKRRERYEGAADIVIQTDDKSILQVCEELISRLMELGGE